MTFRNLSVDSVKIEQKANNLRSDYFRSHKKTFDGPVPVDHILEFLGYDLEFRSDGIYKDKDVLGGVLFDQKLVQINEFISNQEGRMNFTIAHEIGHIVLHSKLNDNSCEFRDNINEAWDENKKEIEADKFASNLLMPRDIVRDVFFKAYSKPITLKVGFLDILLNRTKRSKGLKIAAKIQSNYQLSNVSKLAVLNKLIDLKLIQGLRFQKNVEYKKRRR